MALAPDSSHPTSGGGSGPGVLASAQDALSAVTGADPTRLWALTDPQVAQALGVLAELGAAVRAQVAVVLAEAKGRGLGSGQGWGPVDLSLIHI